MTERKERKCNKTWKRKQNGGNERKNNERNEGNFSWSD